MFRRIGIDSYRGLRNVELNNLGQINVIVGANNSGKTSILEAIQLFDNEDVLENIIAIAKRRESQVMMPLGKNRLLPFEMFLYSFDMHEGRIKELYLEAETYEYKRCCVGVQGVLDRDFYDINELPRSEAERYRMCADEDGYIRELDGEYIFDLEERKEGVYHFRETQLKPSVSNEAERRHALQQKKILYISPMDIYTNRIISASIYKGMLAKEKSRLIDLLRLFDDRIINIETVMNHGYPAVGIETEDCGLVPISIFGDGLKKVLALACAVVKMKNGVILIDEFETGIHKRALEQVAEWLASVAESYNVQVFLTTHSSDAIEALVETGRESNFIKAYRLEHYKENIYVKEFQGNELYMLGKHQGMDIL